MFFARIFGLLVVLSTVPLREAQAETTSLFALQLQNASLSGSAVGTGSLGTTYVLEGSTMSTVFTVTLVEGAADAIETADIPDPAMSNTILLAASCSISGTEAVCEQKLQEGTMSLLTMQTVAFSPFPVILTSVSGLSTSASSSPSTTAVSTTFESTHTNIGITPPLSSLTSTSPASSSTSAATTSSTSPGTRPRVSQTLIGLLSGLPLALAFWRFY